MDIPDDDLRACLRVLRALEADRSYLTRLTQEQRRSPVYAPLWLEPPKPEVADERPRLWPHG